MLKHREENKDQEELFLIPEYGAHSAHEKVRHIVHSLGLKSLQPKNSLSIFYHAEASLSQAVGLTDHIRQV